MPPRPIRTQHDAERRVFELRSALRDLLVVYEQTGDHQHEPTDALTGPGDCVACRARRELGRVSCR